MPGLCGASALRLTCVKSGRRAMTSITSLPSQKRTSPMSTLRIETSTSSNQLLMEYCCWRRKSWLSSRISLLHLATRLYGHLLANLESLSGGALCSLLIEPGPPQVYQKLFQPSIPPPSSDSGTCEQPPSPTSDAQLGSETEDSILYQTGDSSSDRPSTPHRKHYGQFWECWCSQPGFPSTSKPEPDTSPA